VGNFDLAVDGAKCVRILTHQHVNQNCTSNLNPRAEKLADFIASGLKARLARGSSFLGRGQHHEPDAQELV
jgi:hypothetical protein